MSVLVYIELQDGAFKKKSLEAINYAHNTSNTFGGKVIAVVGGTTSNTQELAQHGADTIINVPALQNNINAAQTAECLKNLVQEHNAHTVVIPFDINGKAISPILAAQLKAGLVSGCIDYPTNDNGLVVKKSVFSGKAFSYVKVNTPVRVLAITPNSHPITLIEKTAEVIEYSFSSNISTPAISKVKEDVIKGEVPLSDAELVVSGGRGLKGPENWGILEDLAKSLGATLACSRPVADAHWRPHHEHVGQTGGTIRPNLYIACGISGAIQHLAGVNNSKTIVVINTDPEAPFFKAADYGIVGDVFEVLPKLTDAINRLK